MKKNILIIYDSKYGSTKQYAEIIKKKLHADINDIKHVDFSLMSHYDIVIFGSYIHVGKVHAKNFIKKHWYSSFASKDFILFTTSGEKRKLELDKIFNNNFDAELREKMKYFGIQGVFDYNKLNWFDKLLMNGAIFVCWFKSTFKKDKDAIKMMAHLKSKQGKVSEKNVSKLISLVKKL